ncbi:MAG: Gfo/Idh/MocA family oxidoreductase [Sphaerospermopsis sp. SIO1G2]|nr:Gfo/Idh/MocA family oxidoreductase [Sphaerospermopsis sp. SIO1G2]
MLNQVGFALLGCGQIAKKHAQAIENISQARLIAVCDPIIEKAQSLGEEYQVPWFTNPHQMMEKIGNDIHVVNILTPSGYHCANLLELVTYQKHFCVEKPLALNLKDADDMIAACEKADLHLFVVKQNRFNLPIQKLQEAIVQERLGKLVMGSAKIRWCRPQSYYDQAKWRGTWALDGGVFANQAPHFIDLLQWLMGDVESVFAKGTSRLAKIETEDTGVAIFKFKSGALGVLEATTAARPTNAEGSLAILGEGGIIEVGGFAVNDLRTWKFVNPQPEDEHIFQKLQQPTIPAWSHTVYLQTVVDTITEGKNPAVDGKAGKRSLELILAIYESMETGSEIQVCGDYPHVRLNQPITT